METRKPISPRELERVLKYLPEPSEIRVELANFDCSDINNQASKIAQKLDVKIKKLQYISTEAVLEDQSKEKIIRICELDYERTGREIDRRFIRFKKAEWKLPNLNIELDHFSIHVVCCDKIPDYIEKMREELKNTFVDYKIEQRQTLY